jgi:KipI family sensor histidine kinase inhibitor
MMIDVRPAGDRALLLTVDDSRQVRALYAALRAAAIPGVLDLLPAAVTVLVQLRPLASLDAVRHRVRVVAESVVSSDAIRTDRATRAGSEPAVGGTPMCAAPERIVLPVRYDGPDLAAVADLLECTVDDVVRRHTAAVWTCAFVGFAPGFAYLESADWPFDLPRRAAPRTRVPAGTVAVAAGYSAVYPAASPGGWHLIGTTTVGMFNVKHNPPALISTGRSVCFEPTPGRREVWR